MGRKKGVNILSTPFFGYSFVGKVATKKKATSKK